MTDFAVVVDFWQEKRTSAKWSRLRKRPSAQTASVNSEPRPDPPRIPILCIDGDGPNWCRLRRISHRVPGSLRSRTRNSSLCFGPAIA